MSDTATRESPFAGLFEPGSQAAADGATGVHIEERADMALLQVMARHGRAAELGKKLAGFLGRKAALAPFEAAQSKGLFICATGPEEYWVLADGRAAANAVKSLQKITGDTASVFDQSAGRAVVRLSGARAARVLAKGTALDLHPRAFPASGGAHTTIAHIPALVARREKPACYDVCVPVSYAASFAAWLLDAAREYGYRAE